ncbi:MAG: hypothetical protein ACXVXI_10720, partial [Mycobacteriaceae bacterium]
MGLALAAAEAEGELVAVVLEELVVPLAHALASTATAPTETPKVRSLIMTAPFTRSWLCSEIR